MIVDAYYEQVYVSHDLRIGALRAFVSEHLTHALESVRRSADDVKVVADTDDDAIRLQTITAHTFDAAVYGRPRVSVCGLTSCIRHVQTNTLLLHTGGRWCAACYTMTHVLHTVFAYYRRVQPAIINTDIDFLM